MKIHKFIAKSTPYSLRSAEKMIALNQVMVNDLHAHIGQILIHGDVVTFGDYKLYFDFLTFNRKKDLVILAMNKPLGVICSNDDPQGRKTSYCLLNEYVISEGLSVDQKFTSVGRLDINTSGLLLWCNDGYLAHRLMHPSSNITRVYHVKVMGEYREDVKSELLKGVELDGVKCQFKSIKPLFSNGHTHTFEVTVTSGRYRMVRRMWQSVGFRVLSLKRLAYGDFVLPEKLAQGGFYCLNATEIRWFEKLC